MAVIISMTYQKKLGLPQYSSHSCSLSVQVEVSDQSQVADESSRLYHLLQSSVDAEIKKVGFMPDVAYGIGNGASHENGVPVSNGVGQQNGKTSLNGHHDSSRNGADHWNCTDGQKDLILRIVNEGRLDKLEVEQMAQHLFGVRVRTCNKQQASQLIAELLEKTGKKVNGRSRWRRPVR